VYYGDGISAKDLSEPRFKKSRADQVTLGAVVATSRIHDIQGAARSSPLVGQSVADVPGIVTALRSNGVYFEDPQPDANPATSEGGVRVHVVGAEGGSWRRRAGQRSRREFRSGGATGLVLFFYFWNRRRAPAYVPRQPQTREPLLREPQIREPQVREPQVYDSRHYDDPSVPPPV